MYKQSTIHSNLDFERRYNRIIAKIALPQERLHEFQDLPSTSAVSIDVSTQEFLRDDETQSPVEVVDGDEVDPVLENFDELAAHDVADVPQHQKRLLPWPIDSCQEHSSSSSFILRKHQPFHTQLYG